MSKPNDDQILKLNRSPVEGRVRLGGNLYGKAELEALRDPEVQEAEEQPKKPPVDVEKIQPSTSSQKQNPELLAKYGLTQEDYDLFQEIRNAIGDEAFYRKFWSRKQQKVDINNFVCNPSRNSLIIRATNNKHTKNEFYWEWI